MSIEKVREEYEVWVLREYPNQHMGRFATGEYHSTVIEDCWQAWQASREALVIELPKDFGTETGKPFGDLLCLVSNAAFSECRKAIKAAGVKVKP
ncbi:hypothetical protein KIH13_12415 [Pseudomonas viridiflava]|nr:hypothetical protein KIH13_12415 [Pseudomonas viridiflava]